MERIIERLKADELMGKEAIAVCNSYNKVLPLEVGTRYLLTNGQFAEVINIRTSTYGSKYWFVGVRLDWGAKPYETSVNKTHLLDGKARNPYGRQVYGIGYIGEGFIRKQGSGGEGLHYDRWHAMMRRCYEPNQLESYKGVTVSEELHCFANFQKLALELKREIGIGKQEDFRGWEFDKDVLDDSGKRMYSRETLCLVPGEINTLFTRAQAAQLPKNISFSPVGNHIQVASRVKDMGGKISRMRAKYTIGKYGIDKAIRLSIVICREQRTVVLEELFNKYKDTNLDPRVLNALKSVDYYLNRYLPDDEESIQGYIAAITNLTEDTDGMAIRKLLPDVVIPNSVIGTMVKRKPTIIPQGLSFLPYAKAIVFNSSDISKNIKFKRSTVAHGGPLKTIHMVSDFFIGTKTKRLKELAEQFIKNGHRDRKGNPVDQVLINWLLDPPVETLRKHFGHTQEDLALAANHITEILKKGD